VVKIETPGDMIVKNKQEGGAVNGGAGNPTHGEFHVIFPFGDLNPITIFNLIKDLLSKRDNLDLKLRFFRDGKDITWTEELVRQLGETGSVSKLLPFIGVILAHIKFEVIGLDVTQTMLYREIVKLVEKYVSEHFPHLASSIPSVGQDIPQTMLNSTMLVPNQNTSTQAISGLQPRGIEATASQFIIIGH
jgi:hypothetical protein